MFKKIIKGISLINSILNISEDRKILSDLFNQTMDEIDDDKDNQIEVFELIKYFIELVIEEIKEKK